MPRASEKPGFFRVLIFGKTGTFQGCLDEATEDGTKLAARGSDGLRMLKEDLVSIVKK